LPVTLKIAQQWLQQLRASCEPQHYYGPSHFGRANRFVAHEQILLPLYDETGSVVAAIGALDYEGFTPEILGHQDD
jgi:hypothetical protein